MGNVRMPDSAVGVTPTMAECELLLGHSISRQAGMSLQEEKCFKAGGGGRRIMAGSVPICGLRLEGAQRVLSPWAGTVGQQQPRDLSFFGGRQVAKKIAGGLTLGGFSLVSTQIGVFVSKSSCRAERFSFSFSE